MAVPGTGTIAAAVLQILAARSTRTVTVAELREALQPATVTVYNPVYKRTMVYQGFWLEQVLERVRISLKESQDIVFLAADEYGTSFSVLEIGRRKWLLAYDEPGGWTPLPGHVEATSPGPWYLIGRDSASYKTTPWPYRVTTIKIRDDW